MTWFKTIFILEIAGEISLKLVPDKYKKSVMLAMKVVLLAAVLVPILELKGIDAATIFDAVSAVKTDAYAKTDEYRQESGNIGADTEGDEDATDEKAYNLVVREDIRDTAAEYGLYVENVECELEDTDGKTAIIGITVRVTSVDSANESADTPDNDAEEFTKYISVRYGLARESVSVKES